MTETTEDILSQLVEVIKSGGEISSSKDKIGFAFKLHEAINKAELALRKQMESEQ